MASPKKGAIVEQSLNDLNGVEVHARGDDGRMVVTVEGPLSRECANMITDMNDIDGVISTSLVYHEIDTEEPQQESAQ